MHGWAALAPSKSRFCKAFRGIKKPCCCTLAAFPNRAWASKKLRSTPSRAFFSFFFELPASAAHKLLNWWELAPSNTLGLVGKCYCAMAKKIPLACPSLLGNVPYPRKRRVPQCLGSVGLAGSPARPDGRRNPGVAQGQQSAAHWQPPCHSEMPCN